ncbi:TonB-dependent receptor [Altererythrobacter sp.]|uniref:TonB-dependent receptor n=1 Tax=Altererythrobacter sp. TaxID=1872480 RepID=UPI003D007DE2
MKSYRQEKSARIALAIGASAIALGIGAPAFAQDEGADTASAPGNNVIIVTAQFREQNIQDTPLAITAITADAIEAKSQTNLAQVADTAPNVAIRPQGASFGPSVTASIRGVGQNDFNPAYEPGVGIYIDDVYYPQLTGAIFDLLDVERVEILRGPQGTLTGRNSAGGAIKFYSKKPNGDGSGFLEASYGSRDRISLRGAADFGITDTLAMRVSGVFKEQDGYVDRIDYGCENPTSGIPATTSGNCVLSKLGGVGYEALRGILAWTPTDRIDLTISADYVKDERTIAGEVLLRTGPVWNPSTAVNGVTLSDDFVCGKYCNYSTTGQPGVTADFIFAPGSVLEPTSGTDRSEYKGWGVSANLSIELADWIQLTSITGYREFDTEFYTDDDLTPINTNFGRNFLANESFSQELRLNMEPADGVNITLGGYYFEQDSVYDSFQDIRYVPVFPLQFRQPDPTSADAYALFGNLSWELTDALTLNAGLRYTDESKQQTYYRYNLDGVTINPWLDLIGAVYGEGYSGPDTLDVNGNGDTTDIVTALSGLTAKYSADRLDYRVALDYRWSDSFLTYVSVATGFKGGGSNPRPFNPGQVISFQPEKVTAYEIGFKSDFANNRVRLNAAAFLNDYTDLQVPVLACPDSPCAARLNAGDVEVYGFELELTAEPVDGFNLDASLSYIDQSIDADSLDPSAAVPPFGNNPAGVDPGDPPNVPKWKFNVGAQYRAELGNGAGTITPRLDLYHQAKQYSGPDTSGATRGRTFLPSFTTLNGRITWSNADEDLDISLEVTNITDEYYYLSRFNLLGAGAGFDKALPARPREWAVSVKKRF